MRFEWKRGKKCKITIIIIITVKKMNKEKT